MALARIVFEDGGGRLGPLTDLRGACEVRSGALVGWQRLEADAIIAQGRADAERLRDELRQKAKSDADTLVKNAERQIQLETGRALQQIRAEAVDLSVSIASKLIGRNLSREDNQRLIDDTLKQIEPRH